MYMHICALMSCIPVSDHAARTSRLLHSSADLLQLGASPVVEILQDLQGGRALATFTRNGEEPQTLRLSTTLARSKSLSHSQRYRPLLMRSMK